VGSSIPDPANASRTAASWRGDEIRGEDGIPGEETGEGRGWRCEHNCGVVERGRGGEGLGILTPLDSAGAGTVVASWRGKGRREE
jgi:hypothetical protein